MCVVKARCHRSAPGRERAGQMTDELATVDVSGAVTSDTGSFAMVPLWLLDSLVDLGRTNALALYVALGKWEDRTTHEAWPSHLTLADTLGVGLSTIKRWIADLVHVGAIEVESRKTKAGDADSNRYTLIRRHPSDRRGVHPMDRRRVTSGPTGGSMNGRTGGSTSGLRTKNQFEPEPEELKPFARKLTSVGGRRIKDDPVLARAHVLADDYWNWHKRTKGAAPLTPLTAIRARAEECLRAGWSEHEWKIAAVAVRTTLSRGALQAARAEVQRATNGERWAVPQ